jgi:hypothetical protein
MGKYGRHMVKNGVPIYDLGHMGFSLKLNSDLFDHVNVIGY